MFLVSLVNSLSLRYLWFDIEIRTQAGNERMCTCPEVFLLFITEFAVEDFRKLDGLQEIPLLVVTRSSNLRNLLTFLSTLSMSVGQERIVRSFLLNSFMLY